jgi:hypothetical protein
MKRQRSAVLGLVDATPLRLAAHYEHFHSAAMRAGVDYLVTLDRRHFLDDPEVARRSGLRIGAPGDSIAWFRALLERK